MEAAGQELPPSILGTKEYWDDTYANGMKNFRNSGVVDEGWFGKDSTSRIVKWLSNSKIVRKTDYIADLGCGNGQLLLELALAGFINLKGFDYSAAAIELARSIASKQGASVDFEVVDLLNEKSQNESFHIALDKGTYDAISLHPESAAEKRDKYCRSVWSMLKPEGLLLITSCNWTKEELKLHFEPEFNLLHTIPTPTFAFGGSVGNTVAALVFQKKLNTTEDDLHDSHLLNV